MFPSSTRDIPAASAVPRHVAIIMDGNGRWAKQRMLPRVAGHRRGVEAVRAIIRACIERGIELPDAVRVLERELAPPARRGLDPDGALPARARAGSREAARERHPLQGRRRHCRGSIARIRELDRRRRGADRRQHAADADDRGELRRALGHRAGGAPRISRSIRSAARDGADARARSARAVPGDGATRRSPTCSSAPAASSGSRTSCCGSSRTPSSISPTCCGPTSTRSRSTRRSRRIGSASAASAGPASRCRRRRTRRRRHDAARGTRRLGMRCSRRAS